MGKIYALILLTFTCKVVLAQDKLLFNYDDSGNRIQRLFQSGALPVFLISFDANKDSEGAAALLTWQTSSEINADRFDIERSQDGKKWINIGNVTANGDTKNSSLYSFYDKNPKDGENLYRLKMIDLDGSSAYSRIQGLSFENEISFYPNPVKDQLKIKGAAVKKIQLINSAGKVVFTSDYIPTEGISMGTLSTGVYLVRVTHEDGSWTMRKIVKQ